MNLAIKQFAVPGKSAAFWKLRPPEVSQRENMPSLELDTNVGLVKEGQTIAGLSWALRCNIWRFLQSSTFDLLGGETHTFQEAMWVGKLLVSGVRKIQIKVLTWFLHAEPCLNSGIFTCKAEMSIGFMSLNNLLPSSTAIYKYLVIPNYLILTIYSSTFSIGLKKYPGNADPYNPPG